MIDWLRRKPTDPVVVLTDRSLPLAIRRHPSAKQMTLRIAPDGSEVRVTLPRWGRTGDALAFAESRIGWLEEQLAKLPVASPPVAGGTISYRGEEIEVRWEKKLPRTPRIDADTIQLGGPEETIAKRLQRWLEGEALRLLEADLAHYCEQADCPVPKLRLSRAQRRWGSCSTSGTVRINWRLVQAPDDVRRSVVAHEVAHIVHFDHSPEFHALLAQLFEGEMKEADRWLKQHGRGLYAGFG